jgi:predicted dehydrogenase
MEKNIPTLCEKPLATNIAEADRIIRAVKKSGAPLLVNFKMRQGENFQRIKEYLQKPEVGHPLTIMSRYALVTDPEIWSPPKWFWDEKISGGMLIENGGHTYSKCVDVRFRN